MHAIHIMCSVSHISCDFCLAGILCHGTLYGTKQQICECRHIVGTYTRKVNQKPFMKTVIQQQQYFETTMKIANCKTVSFNIIVSIYWFLLLAISLLMFQTARLNPEGTDGELESYSHSKNSRTLFKKTSICWL